MIMLLPLPFMVRKCNISLITFSTFFTRVQFFPFLPKQSPSFFEPLCCALRDQYGKEHFQKHSGNPEEERGQFSVKLATLVQTGPNLQAVITIASIC